MRVFRGRNSPFISFSRSLATKSGRKSPKKEKNDNYYIVKIPKFNLFPRKLINKYSKNLRVMSIFVPSIINSYNPSENLKLNNLSEKDVDKYTDIWVIYGILSVLGIGGFYGYHYYHDRINSYYYGHRVNLGSLIGSSILVGGLFGGIFGVFTGAIWPISSVVVPIAFGLSQIEFKKEVDENDNDY